jgi:CDP-diacylglycerol--glycerol-3-phosphate 3-phosphatidyltransferase
MRIHGAQRSAAVPLALTTLRVLLAPLIVLLARVEAVRSSLVACLCAGLASDILDGVIARHLGVASTALRRYDSLADTAFYLSALYAAWILHPEVVRARARGLVVLFGLELARYAADFYKFGREASYHMWSAKCWNLIMFAAFVALLGLGFSRYLFAAAVWAGVATDLEGLSATLLLPRWTHDVPTVWHAYRIRRSWRERRA